MKRILLSLTLCLFASLSLMAQKQIVIKTASGEVDTYPFSRDTQIRFGNGKVEFRTTNTTKVYSPSEIATLGFDVLIERITLNYEVYELKEGGSVSLEAIIAPDNATNKTLVWSSSNEDAVMVTQKGKAIYVDNGEAIITATATDGSGISASCIFSCTNGILTVFYNDSSLKIYNAEGRKIPDLKPGLNIIQMEDKTVKKIFIK